MDGIGLDASSIAQHSTTHNTTPVDEMMLCYYVSTITQELIPQMQCDAMRCILCPMINYVVNSPATDSVGVDSMHEMASK